MSRRASLVVFLSLAGTMLLMSGISAGAAQEDTQSKKAEVGDARERLMQARMEQSAAYESYNAALGELNQLDGKIAGTERDLQSAEARFAGAKGELEERASQVYKSGNVAFMDVLVGVDDFSDFATRLDLWMKLLEEERAEFEEVRQARNELRAEKDRLEAQRAQRTEAIEAAIDRKEQAENAEAEAQAYLDSLSGELRSLIQADQERRAAEARANAEKLRAKFLQASEKTPAPAPVQAAPSEEPPEQRLSLRAQQPAPAAQPEPQPDPELLAQQEEAERLAAERAAAAEQARAEQAEAERQAELAAQRAEAREQKAAERREARERAAAAEAAQRRAEQAAIEQAAAELAAQRAAERRAQRQAELEAQRQAELEAQRQAEREARQAAAAEEQYEPAAEEQYESAGGEQYEAGPVPPEAAPTGPAPSASPTGNAVVAEAAKYLGTPYVLGGAAECVPYEMMDCNCLTAKAYEPFGIYLPDGPLEGQTAYGTPVSGPPQAGDLLAWSEDGSGYITHLGIAMGDGTTIHASAYAGFVVSGTPIDAIPGYIGAFRLL